MIFFRRLAQAELINNLANLSDRTLAGSDGFSPSTNVPDARFPVLATNSCWLLELQGSSSSYHLGCFGRC